MVFFQFGLEVLGVDPKRFHGFVSRGLTGQTDFAGFYCVCLAAEKHLLGPAHFLIELLQTQCVVRTYGSLEVSGTIERNIPETRNNLQSSMGVVFTPNHSASSFV